MGREARRKREDMAFDLDGKPLSMSPDQVRQKVDAALDDPNSELVAVILRQHGQLFLQVMGPPSRETLTDLQEVMQTMINGYSHILKGQ
jgi:hypothetical protein